MPTGFTYPIIDGEITTFRDYAINCMKAFSVEGTFSFEPNKYYREQYDHAVESLDLFISMTEDELKSSYETYKSNTIKQAQEAMEKQKGDNKKLEAMTAIARKFIPPTNDHQKYKEFMIEQLKISISDTTEYWQSVIDNIKPFDRWAVEERIRLTDQVVIRSSEYSRELVRMDQKRQWVTAIMNQLDAQGF